MSHHRNPASRACKCFTTLGGESATSISLSYKLWNWVGSRASIFICQVSLPFPALLSSWRKATWILHCEKKNRLNSHYTLHYTAFKQSQTRIWNPAIINIFMSPLSFCDVPQLRFCHCLKFHCLLCKTRHSPDRTLKGNFLQMTRKSTHLCKLISWWVSVLRLPTKS